ncbi:TPA: hypothetical protein SIF59_004294 [Escherichia coli]|jgi:hypothetical protein|nr:hypothetical protein [Escherichia coli]
MACEVLTREFENSDGELKLFAVTQLAASKALDLYVELMNKVGTTVFPLIDNNYNFTDLITFMRANADNKVITDLLKRGVCMAHCEGQEIKPAFFDITFNSNLMMACQVFAFVLEANFKSFFKQGLEMNEQFRLAEVARLKAEEQSRLNQTQTSATSSQK